MTRPYDIITFADTAADLLLTGGDVVPQFGQAEKLVDGYALELGGSCCLFAAQAAKLGMRVAVLGRIGDDVFGQLVRAKLEEAGVDTRYLVTDPALQTGVTVHLSPTGGSDRAMLTYLGSLDTITPERVTDEFLQSARHLHYGSLFLLTRLLPGWVDILRRAKAFGLTLSLDTNWDPSERWESGLAEALPLVDLLLPNDAEARHIARTLTWEAAIPVLQMQVGGGRTSGKIALKQGEAGARLFWGDQVFTCAPPPAEPGGDSTGAGDSFDAGFLAGWLSDLPPQACLEIACACGRAVAGQRGGYAGQPRRADIPALAALDGSTIKHEETKNTR